MQQPEPGLGPCCGPPVEGLPPTLVGGGVGQGSESGTICARLFPRRYQAPPAPVWGADGKRDGALCSWHRLTCPRTFGRKSPSAHMTATVALGPVSAGCRHHSVVVGGLLPAKSAHCWLRPLPPGGLTHVPLAVWLHTELFLWVPSLLQSGRLAAVLPLGGSLWPGRGSPGC